MADIVQRKFDSAKQISVLCHGSRNGFEVKTLQTLLPSAYVIGTDISDNASSYGLVEWDFHDINKDWLNSFDCIYTNSLDQSWKPKEAIETWVSQLKNDGLLIIEHTEAHSPSHASKMDPFGVRPVAFPYVISKWFGDSMAISFEIGKKSNMDLEAYLFVLRKTNFS